MGKHGLKVLLINPPSDNYWEIPQRCWPPINLVLIAGSLIEKNIGVEILDANALSMSLREICNYVSEFDANLIGIPLYSEQVHLIFDLTLSIKKYHPHCSIVLGGPHVSALPEKTLEQFRYVDYVLQGEAEKSFLDLCLAIIEERKLTSVLGLTFRNNNGEIISNDSASIEEKLDNIGHPKRELLDKYYEASKYNTIILHNRNVDTLLTSRGYPFQCNFCHNINPSYRFHSVGCLVEEIITMYKRGIKVIEVVDDNFTANRERAVTLFKEIIKEKLDLNFRIKSRVDMVDEELMSYAKKAGVYLIAYGAESGSQYILDRMNKRIRVTDTIDACRLTKRFGIYCHTTWIIGYPGETIETINETVKLIKVTKPTTVQIEILKPYPSTTVYNEAIISGSLNGDWSPYSKNLPWVQLP